MKKRLPLLIVLGGALVLWKTGAFGFLTRERTVVWRFPVSYGEVRKVELQVWEGDELLKQAELVAPTGLTAEPTMTVPLGKGVHRAIATVQLVSEGAPRGYQREFDPAGDDTIVLDMKKP